MLGELLSFFLTNFTLIFQVAFVSHKYFANVIVRKSVYLVHPLTHIFKSFPICYVIHDNDSMSSPVVTRRESTEPFLARSVPYLQFDVLVIHLYSLYFEIHPDGVEKVFVK